MTPPGCLDELADVEALLRALQARCADVQEVCARAASDASVAAREHAGVSTRLKSIEDQIGVTQTEHLEARDRVAAMTKAQLNEVKSLKGSPPLIVRRALESVWVVLNCGLWQKGDAALKALDLSKEWAKIQRMLTSDNFVPTVVSFDPARLDTVPWVVDYLTAQYFTDLGQLASPGASVSLLPAASREGAPPSTPGSASSSRDVASSPGQASTLGGAQAAQAAQALPRSPSSSSATGVPLARSGTAEGSGPPAVALQRAARSQSLQSAGLSAVASRPRMPRQGNVPAQGPLDVSAVEKASKASAVLVRWCLQVVREFVLLRSLRAERAEVIEKVDLAEAVATERRRRALGCQEELDRALAEWEAVRDRLARLRLEAQEAQIALRNMQRLRKFQDSLVGDSHTVGSQFRPPTVPKPDEERDYAIERVAEVMRRFEDLRAAAAAPPEAAPPPRAAAAQAAKAKAQAEALKAAAAAGAAVGDEGQVATQSAPGRRADAFGASGGRTGSPGASGPPGAGEGATGGGEARDGADGGGLEEDLEDVAVDAAQPAPLQFLFGGAAGDLEDGSLPFEHWCIEFDFNERDVGKRGSRNFKAHRKVCDPLANHLKNNPDAVVMLEGFSDTLSEERTVAGDRASNVATWLTENGVSECQIRLSMPVRPQVPSDRERSGACDVLVGASDGTAAGEDTEDDDEDEEEEEEEEEKRPKRPERCATARPLRVVRIVEGPCSGDGEQAKQPGIFFAPEDASLDSLGPSVCKILRRVARDLQQLFAQEEGIALVAEGHADEGIQDDTLLEWLSESRAAAVKAYLLECAGEPCAEEEEEGKKDEGVAEAKPEEQLVLEPTFFFKDTDIITCSRGRSCRTTMEWGHCGLNRRVQFFII